MCSAKSLTSRRAGSPNYCRGIGSNQICERPPDRLICNRRVFGVSLRIRPRDSWCCPSAGSLSGRWHGSTAAADSPRIGRTSIAQRSRFCASPQSGSCSENFVILTDVSGQTLSERGHRSLACRLVAVRCARYLAVWPAGYGGSGTHGPNRRRTRPPTEAAPYREWPSRRHLICWSLDNELSCYFWALLRCESSAFRSGEL